MLSEKAFNGLLEDPRGAAAEDHLHLRHDRGAQGAGDRALALPALRSAPGRGRACCAASGRDRRPASRSRSSPARSRCSCAPPKARSATACRCSIRRSRSRRRRATAITAVAGAGHARPRRSRAACSTCSSGVARGELKGALDRLRRAVRPRHRARGGAPGPARDQPLADPDQGRRPRPPQPFGVARSGRGARARTLAAGLSVPVLARAGRCCSRAWTTCARRRARCWRRRWCWSGSPTRPSCRRPPSSRAS